MGIGGRIPPLLAAFARLFSRTISRVDVLVMRPEVDEKGRIHISVAWWDQIAFHKDHDFAGGIGHAIRALRRERGGEQRLTGHDDHRLIALQGVKNRHLHVGGTVLAVPLVPNPVFDVTDHIRHEPDVHRAGVFIESRFNLEGRSQIARVPRLGTGAGRIVGQLDFVSGSRVVKSDDVGQFAGFVFGHIYKFRYRLGGDLVLWFANRHHRLHHHRLTLGEELADFFPQRVVVGGIRLNGQRNDGQRNGGQRNVGQRNVRMESLGSTATEA